MNPQAPTLYFFAGCNGAGKTTFARAYLTQLEPIPRFLNADEIARGLSPLAPQTLALRAAKLLLHEIQDCLEPRKSLGLESTLSGKTYAKLLQQAKIYGFQIEIHYLRLPSPELAIRRIAHPKSNPHSLPEAKPPPKPWPKNSVPNTNAGTSHCFLGRMAKLSPPNPDSLHFFLCPSKIGNQQYSIVNPPPHSIRYQIAANDLHKMR